MQAVLVFVEGVSGVGKSTMVQRLEEDLRAKGIAVTSYLEGDPENPIDFYSTAYLPEREHKSICQRYPGEREKIAAHTRDVGGAKLVRYVGPGGPLFSQPLQGELEQREFCYKPARPIPVKEYQAACQKVWQDFSTSLGEDQGIFLFDGSLLHHPLNDLMRNYHLTAERSAQHVQGLLRALGQRQRHIFYLETQDLAGQLEQARKERGQKPLSPKQLAFWEARYQRDQTVLASLEEKCCRYDVTPGWDLAREQMAETLLKCFM